MTPTPAFVFNAKLKVRMISQFSLSTFQERRIFDSSFTERSGQLSLRRARQQSGSGEQSGNHSTLFKILLTLQAHSD